LNIADSARAGAQMAAIDSSLYDLANRKYGRVITPLLGHVPKALAIAHLVRVNPNLLDVPPITLDRRRGFLAATQAGAAAAGLIWANLDNVDTCAYSWCREMNQCSLDLRNQNPEVFSESDADFWKCAYLRHVVGTPLFDVLWEQATNATYSGLVYSVNALVKSPLGWPVATLKKVVLVDLAYVFALASSKGPLLGLGFGIQPVTDKDRTTRILMNDEAKPGV
jgi:hypothetical protein